MGDDEQQPLVVLTKQEESLLVARVVGVRYGNGERVHEGGDCFSEGNAVLPAIRFILGRIPLKRRPHVPSLYQGRGYGGVTEPVFELRRTLQVRLRPEEMAAVETVARSKGVAQEELVHDWILEKIQSR